jgi:phage gpG-like protein
MARPINLQTGKAVGGGGSGKMRVKIKMEPNVKKFFANIGLNAKKALDIAMTTTAHRIQNTTMRNLNEGYKGPTGEDGGALDTGRLANSIHVSDEYLNKKIGTNLNYAAHMEFGTGPAVGKPSYLPPYQKGTSLEGWSRRQQVGDAGTVALQIYRRGTFPRRYMGRAFHTEKETIIHEFAAELEEEINESTGVKVTVQRR